MKEQKKTESGITLIALVISIIVMLILAGVSLNMTVGENGIISQAQDASILNSCAALEEFLQQVYIKEEFDEETAYDDAGSEMSKLDKMIRNHPNWFFMNGSYDYVLTEYTHKAADNSEQVDFLKIRLINTEGLGNDHSDIVNQLMGGKNKALADYLSFKDVYGVTSDLRVFYCADGIDTIVGADYTDSDLLDGSKTLYSSTTGLSKAVAETLGIASEDLSMSDLYGITELSVSDTSGLTDLKSLFDLPNLKKLTLKNYTGSLNGIENAVKLDYLYFNNNEGKQNIDYRNLRYATTITQLYFYMPTDTEVDKLMTEMSNADYLKLQTIGLYGFTNFNFGYFEGHNTNYNSNNRASFSDLSYLNRLSVATKHAVKVLYLNNNSISTINLNFNSQNGFNSVTGLYLYYNLITSSAGLSGANTISTLNLRRNPLTEIDNVPITNLSRLDISTTSVKSLYPVAEGNIVYLDAYDLNELDFDDSKWAENEKDKLNKIGKISILLIPSEYSLYFSNKKVVYVPESYTDTQFSNAITGNQYIESLSITNNKNLNSDVINTVIASLPNLKYFDAYNTNLASLSGLTNKTGILGIRITSTLVTDLKPLKNSADTGLQFIVINNAETVMDSDTIKIINTIMKRKYTQWNHEFFGCRGGFCCSNSTVLKKLEGSADLTHFFMNNNDCNVTLDLTGCSNLVYAYARGAYNLKVKIPATCSYVGLHDGGFRVILPQNGTIPELYQYTTQYNNVDINGGNISKVTINMRGRSESNPSTWLSSINPTTFILTSDKAGRVSTTYTYLGNYTNLTSFEWHYTNVTDVNVIKTIKSTANLLTISLSNNNIKNLSQFTEIYNSNIANNTTNLGNVTTINLSSNSLITIDGLIPEALPSLSSLDLSTNYLENIISITKSNGEKTNMKICDYLATFQNLTYINLSGNSKITDFSGLTNAGYTKSGMEFRRTLSN